MEYLLLFLFTDPLETPGNYKEPEFKITLRYHCMENEVHTGL